MIENHHSDIASGNSGGNYDYSSDEVIDETNQGSQVNRKTTFTTTKISRDLKAMLS